MTAPTKSLRISPFIAFEASGSELTQNPTPGASGYTVLLESELRRVGLRGGTLHLDADSLEDLAEFLDAIAIGNSDSGNHSGARSCATHAERARTLATELRAEG